MAWQWLSFCDQDLPNGSKFLGVCIVEASDIVSASVLAHVLGINPGGEVLGCEVTEPPDDCKNRLLTRDEAERLVNKEWQPDGEG